MKYTPVWNPVCEYENKDTEAWVIKGHEVTLETRVAVKQDYPWQDETRVPEFRGCCKTHFNGHEANWQTTKRQATRDIEVHIEEFDRSLHSHKVMLDIQQRTGSGR